MRKNSYSGFCLARLLSQVFYRTHPLHQMGRDHENKEVVIGTIPRSFLPKPHTELRIVNGLDFERGQRLQEQVLFSREDHASLSRH